jgi:hypothetical protein
VILRPEAPTATAAKQKESQGHEQRSSSDAANNNSCDCAAGQRILLCAYR